MFLFFFIFQIRLGFINERQRRHVFSVYRNKWFFFRSNGARRVYFIHKYSDRYLNGEEWNRKFDWFLVFNSLIVSL